MGGGGGWMDNEARKKKIGHVLHNFEAIPDTR